MRYLKYFEKIEDKNKRMGLYVSTIDILQVYEYLKDKEIKFMILFGGDDTTDDDCFLILIEGNYYQKLPYISDEEFKVPFKDYYVKILDTDGFSDNVFTNWFVTDEIEGNWKIINDIEEIKIIIDTNKYNL